MPQGGQKISTSPKSFGAKKSTVLLGKQKGSWISWTLTAGIFSAPLDTDTSLDRSEQWVLKFRMKIGILLP